MTEVILAKGKEVVVEADSMNNTSAKGKKIEAVPTAEAVIEAVSTTDPTSTGATNKKTKTPVATTEAEQVLSQKKKQGTKNKKRKHQLLPPKQQRICCRTKSHVDQIKTNLVEIVVW